MKKLLLLLSLLLATNAWSEDMRLKCSITSSSGQKTDYIITFDKNEGEYADIIGRGGMSSTSIPIRWSPEHITLDYKYRLLGDKVDNTIVINRSDLTFSMKEIWYTGSQGNDYGPDFGTCKVVEIDTSKNVF